MYRTFLSLAFAIIVGAIFIAVFFGWHQPSAHQVSAAAYGALTVSAISLFILSNLISKR